MMFWVAFFELFTDYLQNQSSPNPNSEKQKRAKSFTYNSSLGAYSYFSNCSDTLWANKICKKFDSIYSDLLGFED